MTNRTPTDLQAKVLTHLEQHGPCIGTVIPAPIGTWETCEKRKWADWDPTTDMWTLSVSGREALAKWRAKHKG